MATPNERLANSLNVLRELQQSGRRVFQSGEMGRVHRERLLKNGFLQEAVRGWLISSSPSAREGDTTPWYPSFWESCARYCNERFGTGWCLSAEQSVMLHAANTVTPVASSGDGTKWEQQQDRASVNANISVFAELLSKCIRGVDQNVA